MASNAQEALLPGYIDSIADVHSKERYREKLQSYNSTEVHHVVLQDGCRIIYILTATHSKIVKYHCLNGRKSKQQVNLITASADN